MTTPVIRTRGLTKTFGAGRGVTGVDLDVDAGQVFGFLGPNGAGKSTTIRLLLGLQRAASGTVEVLGSMRAGDPAVLRHVGYLPGEFTLPDVLTGREVLDRFTRMRGMRDTSVRDALVERFGVELSRPLRQLSKGNRQKLGLVQAFMHRPRLLVLDEPTSGLDPLLREEFRELLLETAAEGRTVLLSSHDLDEVQRTATRVAIIREGRIVVDDTVEALRRRAPTVVEVGFDHDVDASALAGIPGVTVTARTPRRVGLTLVGSVAPLVTALAPLHPTTLGVRPPELADVFLAEYGESRGGAR